MASARDLNGVKVPDAPVGELEDFDKQVRLMFDLIALAYQADLTRVATYVMVAEGTNRTYQPVGVPDSFHPVSHHANERERIRRLTLIQRYHMERFADFVKKLAKTPRKATAASSTIRCSFMARTWATAISTTTIPCRRFWSAAPTAAHVGGKNLVLPERTPLANLHLTILDKLGIRQASFGNSTGLLTEV